VSLGRQFQVKDKKREEYFVSYFELPSFLITLFLTSTRGTSTYNLCKVAWGMFVFPFVLLAMAERFTAIREQSIPLGGSLKS
jgi:hypothetical protein